LEAARIITGLPIFTNTEYLYRETGWERLEERRTRRTKTVAHPLIYFPIICIFITIKKEMVRIFTWCATVTESI
jgi:hypothetical protein